MIDEAAVSFLRQRAAAGSVQSSVHAIAGQLTEFAEIAKGVLAGRVEIPGGDHCHA